MAKTIGTSWSNIASYNWQPGTGFNITFYLDARYDNIKNDIGNNDSYIYTRLTSVVNAGKGSGYNYNFWCDYAPTVSGSGIWYLDNETITESGKATIRHDEDGTKTIRINAGGSITGIGLSFSMGEDVILETIPRATKITDQIATIGEQIKIGWTKASSNFRHKLTYSFGSITNEVLGENLVDGYNWEVPDKLYQYFTSEPSGFGTLYLTTYKNGDQIGATQSAKITINANQVDAEPEVEDATLKDINSSTIELTGDDSKYVLNQSKIFMTLSFNTRKFATVKNLNIDGNDIDVNQLSQGQQTQDGSMNYGIQYEYGTLTNKSILVNITDSRNFSVTYTLTINEADLINYIPLDAVVNFKRIAPTTGEVGLEFNGNYFNGSFGEENNDLEISYKYKKSNEIEYSNEFTLIKDTDYKISQNTYYSGVGASKQQIKLAPNFDYKSQYDLQLTISDKLTTLPTINVIITKGIPIFWWNGEKVTINGDLYIADADGNNPINVKNLGGGADYDSLPVGSIINFDGDEVPVGYEIVQNNAKILWTNSDPNVTIFNPQDISLNSSDYDYFDVLYYCYKDVRRIQSARVYKSYPMGNLTTVFEYNGAMYAGCRYMTKKSDTLYSISSCNCSSFGKASVDVTPDWILPMMIIGGTYNS